VDLASLSHRLLHFLLLPVLLLLQCTSVASVSLSRA